MSAREELVREVLSAFKTAWQDDYSARSVAEGVTDRLLASNWLAKHDTEVGERVAVAIEAGDEHQPVGIGEQGIRWYLLGQQTATSRAASIARASTTTEVGA